MLYYGMFSHDLHILDLWWSSYGGHYILWRLPLYALLLCSMAHYDITMCNDIARDIHCDITMGNDIARDIHCDITMGNDVPRLYISWHHNT